jgi:beta-phosphoglucomutase-like phosphatase (HAD superfamily)
MVAIYGVVFDLDGLLLDSEEVWDEARRRVAEAAGGLARHCDGGHDGHEFN